MSWSPVASPSNPDNWRCSSATTRRRAPRSPISPSEFRSRLSGELPQGLPGDIAAVRDPGAVGGEGGDGDDRTERFVAVVEEQRPRGVMWGKDALRDRVSHEDGAVGKDDADRAISRASGRLTDSFAYTNMFVMSLLAVSAAADRLGVSVRQVQHLVAHGDLRQVARGLIDETSVERLIAVRGGSHRRAWSETTAWGAVALLAGAEAAWIGATQRSRLKSRLRSLKAVELLERARERAQVTRYAAHSSGRQRLLGELVYAADASGRLGLAATSGVDGYLAASAVAGVVSRHGLLRDEQGRVTLRATSMDLACVRDLAQRSTVLAALDLAESLDVRERRAGLNALDRALETFRG